MTIFEAVDLSLPPARTSDIIRQAERENRQAWRQWRDACLELVPEPGDVHWLEKAANYAGTFALRLSGASALWICVEDNGWEDAAFNRAKGTNVICTEVIRLMSECEVPYTWSQDYEAGAMPGLAYAVARAQEDKVDFPDGHHWQYVLDELVDGGVML